MKKELFQEIEVPEGVTLEVSGRVVTVKGSEGEVSREFKLGKVTLEKKDNKVLIGDKKATKTEKKIINTTSSHLRNMIKGVQDKFEYELLACYSHFPMSIEISGQEATIKNFLGEKIPRKVSIPLGVEIELGKDSDKKVPINIKSINKELAGQAAANFEIATKIRNKDRRVFQDGIFIVNKAGKEI